MMAEQIFTVQRPEDMQSVEQCIRSRLKCRPSGSCSFLASAQYARIRVAALQYVQKLITHEAEMMAVSQGGALVVTLNCGSDCKVTVRELQQPSEANKESPRKRKLSAV
jgi:hypothetical protein